MLNTYQILFKIISKKKINNKAANQVLDNLAKDKEAFDKSIPRGIKERLGRR